MEYQYAYNSILEVMYFTQYLTCPYLYTDSKTFLIFICLILAFSMQPIRI